jgi:hypothetical protein
MFSPLCRLRPRAVSLISITYGHAPFGLSVASNRSRVLKSMEIGFSESFAKLLKAFMYSKLRWAAIPVLGIGLILQVYFFREMVAAELLFGLAFLVMLLLVGIFYVVGAIGERGLDIAEVAVRGIGRSVRRGYGALEVLAKKSVRHPESAR